jgi:hypothetical protein
VLTHTKCYLHDLLGVSIAIRFAVSGYVFPICLGSLVRLNIAEKECTTWSNLMGNSTSNEPVTELILGLGDGLVRDPVAINTT